MTQSARLQYSEMERLYTLLEKNVRNIPNEPLRVVTDISR